jgi:hypothetical protein
MSSQLLILDLANAVHPQAIADALAPYGHVLHVEVRAGRGTEEAGATAVVEMAGAAEARAAAAALDGRELFGHVVRVAMVEGPPPAEHSTLYWSPAARAEVESREERGPRPGDFGDRGGG